MTDKRDEADTIIEIRSGALSIDQRQTVVGLPETGLGAVQASESSLYSVSEQEGVAKFGAFAYDAKTGAFLDSAGPVYGYSRKTGNRALSMFTWDSEDFVPERDAPHWLP